MAEFPIGELVIYKNNQLIAFNKPPGMAVQPDPNEGKSLLELARIYTQGTVHLIHRIDRPASGIVLFAKTERALAHLSSQFRDRHLKKVYLAIVKKPAPEPQGTLTHYLTQDPKTNKANVQDQSAPRAQRAELDFELLESAKELDLLRIALHTGRHHQIRAQLAALGAPIRGDNKYGYKRGNRDRSIQLHAWKLSFIHPVSGVEETITAEPPGGIWDVFESWKRG
jgi:23S rRNA pseudouridine1911/1915/1917 synthase